MRVGIIGGTGFAAAEDAEPLDVETPFGDVTLRVTEVAGARAFVLNRHGGDAAAHGLPPHRVNHRANVAALAAARVDRVIALVSVGALKADIAPGTLLVPDDYVDFSGHPHRTFFEDEAVHVDVSEPYCPVTRDALVAAGGDAGAVVRDGGVYVAAPGPRLETRAEVRVLAGMGDVVGMTGCPEAALAREKGLCYAPLALVANAATGVADAPLSAHAIRDASRRLHADAARVVDAAVRRLAGADAGGAACACAGALDAARL